MQLFRNEQELERFKSDYDAVLDALTDGYTLFDDVEYYYIDFFDTGLMLVGVTKDIKSTHTLQTKFFSNEEILKLEL